MGKRKRRVDEVPLLDADDVATAKQQQQKQNPPIIQHQPSAPGSKKAKCKKGGKQEEKIAGRLAGSKSKSGKNEWHFLECQLIFEPLNVITEPYFELAIDGALKSLYGIVGMAMPVEVVSYDETQNLACLKVLGSAVKKVWCALTMLNTFDGKMCRFDVRRIWKEPLVESVDQ
ncbi:Ribonuclease P protein subunit p14 [Blyttiomyces sp. JEL0837]|nr:Ribonuclease P protein subunit p14 [Blyttiomyces sp. JEL0837]